MPQYHVAVERTDDNRYIASNSRGAELELTRPPLHPLRQLAQWSRDPPGVRVLRLARG